jgi:hypothetical protein
MKRFTKPMLPLLALLLLQISLVHGFQHDASHFDSAPTQTTHSETDCLLGDTSPALASAEPPVFLRPICVATPFSRLSPRVRIVKYLTPPTRAPPFSI